MVMALHNCTPVEGLYGWPFPKEPMNGYEGGPIVPGSSSQQCSQGSELTKPEYSTDDFRMYTFKVLQCSKRFVHDWRQCPFAHDTENARRRDPREFAYVPMACPHYKIGLCLRGDNCRFSHGVYECWLHPSKYRTQMCKDGPNCKRPVCFFAHGQHELREAAPQPEIPGLEEETAAMFGQPMDAQQLWALYQQAQQSSAPGPKPAINENFMRNFPASALAQEAGPSSGSEYSSEYSLFSSPPRTPTRQPQQPGLPGCGHGNHGGHGGHSHSHGHGNGGGPPIALGPNPRVSNSFIRQHGAYLHGVHRFGQQGQHRPNQQALMQQQQQQQQQQHQQALQLQAQLAAQAAYESVMRQAQSNPQAVLEQLLQAQAQQAGQQAAQAAVANAAANAELLQIMQQMNGLGLSHQPMSFSSPLPTGSAANNSFSADHLPLALPGTGGSGGLDSAASLGGSQGSSGYGPSGFGCGSSGSAGAGGGMGSGGGATRQADPLIALDAAFARINTPTLISGLPAAAASSAAPPASATLDAAAAHWAAAGTSALCLSAQRARTPVGSKGLSGPPTPVQQPPAEFDLAVGGYASTRGTRSTVSGGTSGSASPQAAAARLPGTGPGNGNPFV